MRDLAESFSIVLDRIWREILVLEPLQGLQGFHMWHGVAGVCVGAFAMWLLSPKASLGRLANSPANNFANNFVGKPPMDNSRAPESTSIPRYSRFLWVGLAGLVCGGLAGAVESSALLLWILPLVLSALLLCVWDIYYYVVPDWLNLSWLTLGAMKGLAPLAFGYLYASPTLAQSPEALHALSALHAPIDPPIDSDQNPWDFPQNLWEIADVAIWQDMLLGAGLVALVYMLGLMLLHRQLLGEGDIVFCAGFSALFGFEGMLLSIFWGCVVACAFALFVALRRRVLGRVLARFSREPMELVPLIPCMILGLFIGLGLGVLA